MTPARLKELRDYFAANSRYGGTAWAFATVARELLAYIEELEFSLQGAKLSNEILDNDNSEKRRTVAELEADRDNGKWVAAAMKRAGCVPITIEALEPLREDQRRLDWVEEQRAISFGFPIGAAEVVSDMELGKPINVVMKTGLGTHKVTSAAGTKRQCIDAARQSQQKPEGKL